jgi:hypothetical protein
MSLDRLVGSWVFTMHHSELAEPVTGRQRYEPVLDGAFLMMHWHYDHPEFPDAIALISSTQYHYFDVRGVVRVFDYAVDDAGWSMTRLDDEFSQRTIGRFAGADAVDCVGERSANSGAMWQRDFAMRMTRVE